MDTYPFIGKGVVVGIILLFIGVSIIPSAAQDEKKDDGISHIIYPLSNGEFQRRYSFVFPFNRTELAITILAPMKMKIQNVGTAVAVNITWVIDVEGGFLFLDNSCAGTLLGTLAPSQEIIANCFGLLIGFGKIEIIYTAWADNAAVVTEIQTGRLVLYFFIPYKSWSDEQELG